MKVKNLLLGIVVVVAIAAFVPTVYMPYKNKKPQMDSEHLEALSTIEYYEDSIANQASIEAEIADLQAQWEKYRKDMFVEPQTALKDINTAIDELEILNLLFSQGDAQKDPSETVTAEGNPLYYVPITVEVIAERQQLLDLLKFVEVDSVGAYYVKSLKASQPSEKELALFYPDKYNSDTEISSDEKSSDTDTGTDSESHKKGTRTIMVQSSDTDTEIETDTDEEVLKANIQIYLYYFNQDIKELPAETDSGKK